ncbi:MAG: hypothetical protein NVS1B6_14820 [Steroidobacteraceae bacterium]
MRPLALFLNPAEPPATLAGEIFGLSPIFELDFSDSSYGFRPGRNAHQAVKAAQQYVAQGRRVVVDVDVEKFFDRVNHDLLMAKLSPKIDDGRVLQLIRRYLEAGMMAQGISSPRTEGTPHGGPLTPWTQKITSSLNGRLLYPVPIQCLTCV